MRLSGPVTFYEFRIAGQMSIKLIADDKCDGDTCESCHNDEECKTVSAYIQAETDRDQPLDVFVEASFVDKLSKKDPEASVQLGLRQITFDDRIIFRAINFIRSIVRLPELRAGVIAAVVSEFKNELFAPGDVQVQKRFHYTDVRFEPVAYAMMQKVTAFPSDSDTTRLTSETIEYLRRWLPTGAKFARMLNSFMTSPDVLKGLNKCFGAELSVEMLSRFTSDGLHKTAKAFANCPDAYRDPVRKFAQARLAELAVQYDALAERILVTSKRRRPLPTSFHSDFHELWLSGFHVLTVVYTVCRVFRYGSRSKRVIVVASEPTVQDLTKILLTVEHSDMTRRVVGVSDDKKQQQKSRHRKRSRCLYI
jgi:hypothetical protein